MSDFWGDGLRDEILFSLNKRQSGWHQVPNPDAEEEPAPFRALEGEEPPPFICQFIEDCSLALGECYGSEEDCLLALVAYTSSSSSSEEEPKLFYVVKKNPEEEGSSSSSTGSGSGSEGVTECNCDSIDGKWGAGSGRCAGAERVYPSAIDALGREVYVEARSPVCDFLDLQISITVKWSPPNLSLNNETRLGVNENDLNQDYTAYTFIQEGPITRGIDVLFNHWEAETDSVSTFAEGCIEEDPQAEGKCKEYGPIEFTSQPETTYYYSNWGAGSSKDTNDLTDDFFPGPLMGNRLSLDENGRIVRDPIGPDAWSFVDDKGNFSLPTIVSESRVNESNPDFSDPSSIRRFTVIRTDVESFGSSLSLEQAQAIQAKADEWLAQMDQDWADWLASGGTDWAGRINQWFEDQSGPELIQQNVSVIQENFLSNPNSPEFNDDIKKRWENESKVKTYDSIFRGASFPGLCEQGPWPDFCPGEDSVGAMGGTSSTSSGIGPMVWGPTEARVEKYGTPPRKEIEANDDPNADFECVSDPADRDIISGPHPQCIL